MEWIDVNTSVPPLYKKVKIKLKGYRATRLSTGWRIAEGLIPNWTDGYESLPNLIFRVSHWKELNEKEDE